MPRRPRVTMLRLAAEAAANSFARPAVTLGMVFAVAAMLVGSAVAEINATTTIRSYERDLIGAGYATLLVTQAGAGGTALSTRTCAQLGSIDGVRAAVAMSEPEPIHLWTAGGPGLSVRYASGDLSEFVALVESNALAGWTSAQALVDVKSGAASPGPLEYPLRLVDDGAETHDVNSLTVPLSAFGNGLSAGLVIWDARAGPASACFLFVETPRRDYVIRSVDIALPAIAGFARQWVLASADRFEAPPHRFATRPSQYYWAVASLTFIALGALHLRLRRSDHALYAIGGIKRRHIWALATLELALIILVAAMLSIATISILGSRADARGEELRVGYASLARGGIAIVGCAAILARSQANRTIDSTLEAIKDR